MSDWIRLLLANVPLALLIAALVIAAVPRREEPAGHRFLAWVLLLAVGVESVGTGLFHVLAPETGATAIGRRVSLFQFEFGIASMAIGLVAIDSFQRTLPYKSAIAGVAMLFYAGLAIGHVPQVMQAPTQVLRSLGPLLAVTAAKALLLPVLLAWAWAGYKAREQGGRVPGRW